jgi:hypothetical protein
VFGDHGGGSEASYQRTLQQAAGGYPPADQEQDEDDELGDLDAELEGDLYDDDADSNEQERPASMMSPRAESRTVSWEHFLDFISHLLYIAIDAPFTRVLLLTIHALPG